MTCGGSHTYIISLLRVRTIYMYIYILYTVVAHARGRSICSGGLEEAARRRSGYVRTSDRK